MLSWYDKIDYSIEVIVASSMNWESQQSQSLSQGLRWSSEVFGHDHLNVGVDAYNYVQIRYKLG